MGFLITSWTGSFATADLLNHLFLDKDEIVSCCRIDDILADMTALTGEP
jgi:hypothetical protein